jgi:hypothetical protein
MAKHPAKKSATKKKPPIVEVVTDTGDHVDPP